MTSRPACTPTETSSTETSPTETSPTERGASLVEYALLLALVAIVCIGGVTLIGRATMEPLSSVASMFGG